MSIRQAVKRAVLARQGGRCAGIKPDGEPCGLDLGALARAKDLHIRLPRGRRAVEFDHVIARADGGTDDIANIQALCGWCHHAKTELERPGWDAPSPSVYTSTLRTQAQHRPAVKALRLRAGTPAKHYAI